MSYGYIAIADEPRWRRTLRRIMGWGHLVRRLQAPFVLRFLDVKSDHVVLDVGAAGGHHTVEMAKRVRLATALEIQFEGVRPLRRAKAFGRGLTACVGDALALPIRSQSVDRILLSGTLQSLDADRAVAECARVLKSDGVIVASVLAGHPLMKALYSGRVWILGRLLLKLAKAPATYDAFRTEFQRRHFVTRYFAPDDLVELMARHGLRLQESRWIPGGFSAHVVDSLHLMLWRIGSPHASRSRFALLFPFLRLAESATKNPSVGLEWVASFRLRPNG